MRMAERVDRDASQHVDVLLVIGVSHGGAGTFDEFDWRNRVVI